MFRQQFKIGRHFSGCAAHTPCARRCIFMVSIFSFIFLENKNFKIPFHFSQFVNAAIIGKILIEKTFTLPNSSYLFLEFFKHHYFFSVKNIEYCIFNQLDLHSSVKV